MIPSETLRLFAAIRLDPPVCRALGALRDAVKRRSRGGTFTPDANFHLTLAFIGETDRAADAMAVIRETRFDPFDLTFGERGAFRRPGGDISFITVASENGVLESLARDVSDRLRGAGFEIDRRAFKPHITLGRQVVLPPDAAIVTPPIPHQWVARVSLMRSDRIRGQMVYREIAASGEREAR